MPGLESSSLLAVWLPAFLRGEWLSGWWLPALVALELTYLLLTILAVPRRRPLADAQQAPCAPEPGRGCARAGRRGAASVEPGLAPVVAPLPQWPCVSCIVTCYGEGPLVARTLLSLLDQSWPGPLEVLAVIDGALENEATLAVAQSVRYRPAGAPRTLRVVPKWVRGGRASSLNAGLALCQGQLVLALDGDTSFDRDMVARLVACFREPGVMAVAGTLRVRNAGRNVLTGLQALDYALFRQLVRAGLGRLNIVNNIPGAHGAFRREALLCSGGWDNGTAEDVDLSLRLRKCLGRYPGWRLRAAPDVIGHTDVPEDWASFLRQRLRWEGDPVFLFLRKHRHSLRPATMGWRNWAFAMWYGPGFQMLLPLGYLFALPVLLLLPLPVALLSLSASLGLHLTGSLGLLLAQLLLTSERTSEDARRLWLLPLYSPFIFLLRAWSGVAVLHSLVARSERDSSMAPWWVLRKARF